MTCNLEDILYKKCEDWIIKNRQDNELVYDAMGLPLGTKKQLREKNLEDIKDRERRIKSHLIR